MKYTNAFFQLDIRSNGVYIHIFPAKEGGKPIDVKELIEYLGTCGVNNYDVPKLNKAVAQATEEMDLFLSPFPIAEVNETVKLRVTSDKMIAVIRFYPPSKNGRYMTEEEIREELERSGITYGISDKIIRAYLKGRQFCRDIPIARGEAVIQGQNARIVYHFDTNPTAKPKLLEDGSVDFHELNMFSRVNQGDLLAELIPETQGTPGRNVYGKEILPAVVKPAILKYGKNIFISEDQTKIYSDVDGDVKLESDTVFVSNSYTVPADVDPSTGDIRYDGNVIVTGNVRAGFRVEASGDIEVNGVVEAATLIAGGNIVLKRGVQGASKGYLEAGNDIVTKFIESCTVKAGHTINTGSSLHSDLDAGEMIVISGKRGFVIGGSVSAGLRIEASVFGNKMNTATTLRVGVDPEVIERYKDLATVIKGKQTDLAKHNQTVEAYQKMVAEKRKVTSIQAVNVKQSVEMIKKLSSEIEEMSEEYIQLKRAIEGNRGGKIVINHTIYPGVSISISNRIYQVKEVLSRCQFRLEGIDVVSIPL